MTPLFFSPPSREGQGWVRATYTVADTRPQPRPQGRGENNDFAHGEST